jgi:plastocyanin
MILTIHMLGLVLALGFAPSGSFASGPAAAASVVIKNFEFTPLTVVIAAGETIRWTNMDVANHQITTGVVDGPSGPRPDGRVISPLFFRGDEFSATLRIPGRYQYYCRIHPFMRGTVVVMPGGR